LGFAALTVVRSRGLSNKFGDPVLVHIQILVFTLGIGSFIAFDFVFFGAGRTVRLLKSVPSNIYSPQTIRVTGWVCEKIATNCSQTHFLGKNFQKCWLLC
jgi:hypothetical protein